MKRAFFAFLMALAMLAPVCAPAASLSIESDENPFGYRYMQARDTIYYCVQTEEESFSLFRMNADGTGAEKILPIQVESFAMAGSALYFSDRDDYGVYPTRMPLDSMEREILYPNFGMDLQATATHLFWVGDDDNMDSRIFRMALDAHPTTLMAEDTYYIEMEAVEILPVDEPFRIRAHGGWIYYIAYRDATIYLARIRDDGTGDPEILYAPEGLNTSLNILGFEGDAVLFGNQGDPVEAITCQWTEAEGITPLPLPQCFAYSDGFFYYGSVSDSNLPSEESEGLYRCRADGSEKTQITDQDIVPIEIQGDWLFAEIGGGLNAEPVMMPKDGSKEPVTVPGFGVYDYEAHKPESTEPEIDWQYERFGEGGVELYIASHELSACYRLIRVENGEPAGEVLYARTGPFTGTSLYFDPGEYILKIAEGETWISDEAAFGPGGDYTTTEVYTFTKGSYRITTGVTGDFYQDDAKGFME